MANQPPGDGMQPSSLVLDALSRYLSTIQGTFADLAKKLGRFIDLANMIKDEDDHDLEALRKNIISILVTMQNFEGQEIKLLKADHGIPQKEQEALVRDLARDISVIEGLEHSINAMAGDGTREEKSAQFKELQKAYEEFIDQIPRDENEEEGIIRAVKASIEKR